MPAPADDLGSLGHLEASCQLGVRGGRAPEPGVGMEALDPNEGSPIRYVEGLSEAEM